jgi:P4 family phage/plasmid primase-like protien
VPHATNNANGHKTRRRKSRTKGTHQKNGQATGGGQFKQSTGDGDSPPALALGVGDNEPVSISPADLDEPTLTILAGQLAEEAGHVNFTIVNVPGWEDEARDRLLRLIYQVRTRARIEVAGDVFADAFDAMCAGIVGAENLTAHARSVRAAMQAAALFHPGALDAAAGRITARLDELGVPRGRIDTLTKELRRLVGDDNSASADDAANAADAARGFLDSLRQQLDLADDQLPLRYFRSTFYRWTKSCWTTMGLAYLTASVTSWLQEEGTDKIGSRLVNDVIVNLQGLARVDRDWSTDMPFHVNAEGDGEQPTEPLLVFKNGMITLHDLCHNAHPQLLDHDPNWFNEIVLPVAFDAAAECPKWRQFLNQVLPRTGPGDHRQLVLQAFFGYCLMFGCTFERMLILLGEGSNGKSVVLKTLCAMLGERNVSSVPFVKLMGEFMLGSLVGKLANITMELNHLGKTDEACIRSLVSGEKQTINRKYHEPFDTQLIAKLVVATNELPSFADTSNATWRRLLTIPFEIKIAENEANRGLATELVQELPGILNWAIVGLRRLIRKNRFPICSKCAGTLAEHRRDSDSVREFVDLYCSSVPLWQVRSQPLFDIYAYSCELRRRKPVAENEFGKRMKRLGYEKRRGALQPDGTRPYVYRGLRVKQDAMWLATRLRATGRCGWPPSVLTTSG